MSRLADHVRIFDGITPWAGYVPQGYQIDFVGTKIDLKFRKDLGVDPTTGATSTFKQEYPQFKPTMKDGLKLSIGWRPLAKLVNASS